MAKLFISRSLPLRWRSFYENEVKGGLSQAHAHMEARFSSLGNANHQNAFYVGMVYKGQNLVIKLTLDPLNPFDQQFRYFPNGIVQGQVLFNAKCVGYNYPMRRGDGFFFNIIRIEGDFARGILKQMIEPNMAAIIIDLRASTPLCDLLLISDVATRCTEADLRDIKSTSSPSNSSIKRPANQQHSPRIKNIRLPNAPSVQIIPTDDFADALTIAATVLNKLVPIKVFFVYENDFGPKILQYENKSNLEIRRELTDLLWEGQVGGWCGLHSLNFLRRPGDARHTAAHMHEFQKILQKENDAIGNLTAVHKDMVLPDGWITVDFLQAYMTRVMNLQQPSTFLPEAKSKARSDYSKIQAIHNSILGSSLSNNAVAMVVVADAHYYVFRKIKMSNRGEEKIHLAFFDSNYSTKS